jgi:nucleoside phosphorylase
MQGEYDPSMRRRRNRYISPEEEAYVQLLIANIDPENKKVGLETLCKLYRSGMVLRDPHVVVVHAMGLLYHAASRVRRWSLNALSLIGSKDQVVAILEAIKRDQADPDILAAGISALCSILNADEARRVLHKANLPLEGAIVLAAAQQSQNFDKELRRTRVNIETAEVSQLRLAGILVGLGKAPENLFTLKFPNKKVIGQLNTHPDRIVAQYSVWATCENRGLGPKALGIKLKEIEYHPEKVRKYVYKTIVSDVATAAQNYDLLVQGSEDKSVEARTGLAMGFRDTFFDSAEQLILDWFVDEETESVRQRLLEHMAANADKCSLYEKPVLQMYRDADANSLTRSRLESAARTTELHKSMRLIAHEAEGDDLFGYDHVSRRVRSHSGPETPLDQAMQIKVLLVTALPKETAAVKATFDSRQLVSVPDDSNIYEIGVFESNSAQRQVLSAASGMGTLNASSLATNALRSFPKIQYIIMVGIAGGCPNPNKPDEHVRLGDVVLSGPDGIIAHDFVKETIDGRMIRSAPQKPHAALLNVATHLQAEELLGNRPWEAIAASSWEFLDYGYKRPPNSSDVLRDGEQTVPHPKDSQRRDGAPRIFSGVIAAADTLLKNAATRDVLRDRFGVRAVEMEASGVQNAAWHQGKDIFVVRGICDYCDSAKNDDWQKYAALVAAAYNRALVEAMPANWF